MFELVRRASRHNEANGRRPIALTTHRQRVLSFKGLVVADQKVERRLAAVVAADVFRYSRLMEADETGTLAQLKALRREIIDPKIAEYRGRIVKTTGDGILLEYYSVTDAVQCSVDIQEAMAQRNVSVPEDRRIQFRVGINLGEIIIEGDDIYGTGVNVAARLEAMAEPGSICISGNVYDQIRSILSLGYVDLGEQTVKNISAPVRSFAVRMGEMEARTPPAAPVEWHNKATIAVLPFDNLSGDPGQEYFADGMAEDIITALSHIRWLAVIARNSSFAYKGKNVDVKQVGNELGVRYLLEGSVRKAGNRVRITGQLIDTSTMAHLWADRFDGDLDDIFELQDRVTGNVVATVAPKLEHAEIERAKRKQTENLDAYDYFLRGMASLQKWTKESSNEALQLFYRAIERDQEYASAYGMAAWCFVWRKVNGWMVDRQNEIEEATRLARRAVDLGEDDAVALAAGGYALVFVGHEIEDGSAYIDRALALNPNLVWALHSSGWTNAFLGQSDLAIKRLTHAIQLSPLDPLNFRAEGGMALAHFLAGRYDDACLWAEKSLRKRPKYLASIRELAAAHALAGRLTEAQQTMEHLRSVNPELRISTVKDWVPLRRAEDLARLQEGLRKAGLPE